MIYNYSEVKNSYCLIGKESKKGQSAFSEADADGFFMEVFAYLVEIRERERERKLVPRP